MHDISKIFPAIKKSEKQDIFSPSDVSLSETSKAIKYTEEELPVDFKDIKHNSGEVKSQFPTDMQIRAIDSTAFNLGTVEDGVVGVVRTSVIIRKPDNLKHHCEKYGPHIFKITNQDKNTIYQDKFQQVFGTKPPLNSAPAIYKMVDRIRNLAERYIILEEIKNSRDTLILIDGSLISHPVDTPASYLSQIMDESKKNNNIIAAISKETSLVLSQNGKGILSLCDFDPKPTYHGPLNQFIRGDSSRYCGDVYVVKLTPDGEAFRIDIPPNSVLPHEKILGLLAGIAGDYGYPDELKLAHMTSIHSSIEIIELQAAAIQNFNLKIEESIRKKLFPL